VYATGLAQALAARPKDAAPLLAHWPAHTAPPQALTQAGGLWTLVDGDAPPVDAHVYSILYVDTSPVALVRTVVAAHTAPPWHAARRLTEQMGGASTARVVLVAARPDFAPALPAESISLWQAWPLPELSSQAP
jgi:hypothetical protein